MAVFWNRNLALRDKRSSEKRALERGGLCLVVFSLHIKFTDDDDGNRKAENPGHS